MSRFAHPQLDEAVATLTCKPRQYSADLYCLRGVFAVERGVDIHDRFVGWPKSPLATRKLCTRYALVLRDVGLVFRESKHNGERRLTFEYSPADEDESDEAQSGLWGSWVSAESYRYPLPKVPTHAGLREGGPQGSNFTLSLRVKEREYREIWETTQTSALEAPTPEIAWADADSDAGVGSPWLPWADAYALLPTCPNLNHPHGGAAPACSRSKMPTQRHFKLPQTPLVPTYAEDGTTVKGADKPSGINTISYPYLDEALAAACEQRGVAVVPELRAKLDGLRERHARELVKLACKHGDWGPLNKDGAPVCGRCGAVMFNGKAL